MSARLLQVDGLTTRLHLPGGTADAVTEVGLSLKAGETLCIVGESGCGKSMLALSLIGLAPNPPAVVAAGSALFEGRDLLQLSRTELRRIRGRRISMIFQEPMTALNPVMTAGEQIAELLWRHQGLGRAAARAHAVEMLDRVQVPDARQRARAYPHELSGGMRQRVMIAMALACEPALLIADEPTTALDVTIQFQILALLREMQERIGMALILITHDLGVVAEMADRVLVMYAGRRIEEAPVAELFARPLHPYTHGLMASVPVIGRDRSRRLREIAGTVPALGTLPAGCAFAPRCDRASEICRRTRPEFTDYLPGHGLACHHPQVEAAGA